MSNQQIRMNPKTNQNESSMFEAIPGELKLESTKNPSFALQYFPKYLLTEEMALLAIKQIDTMQYWPKQIITEDNAMLAIKSFETAKIKQDS